MQMKQGIIIYKSNTLDLIPAINQLQYNLDHQVDQSKFLGLDIHLL